MGIIVYTIYQAHLVYITFLALGLSEYICDIHLAGGISYTNHGPNPVHPRALINYCTLVDYILHKEHGLIGLYHVLVYIITLHRTYQLFYCLVLMPFRMKKNLVQLIQLHLKLVGSVYCINYNYNYV